MRAMEGNIPGTIIDQLRDRLDIVEVISQYVRLNRSGRNYFGLCPFHGEKTPSFSVSQEKQIYHCFGCGEGGNVFSFIMKIEGLTFPEAVRDLAAKTGFALPEINRFAAQNLSNKRLREALLWSARFFQYALGRPEGQSALNYLGKRGLTDNIRQEFELGFAPDRKDALRAFLHRKGYGEKEMVEAGLLIVQDKKTYDRFRNRIMFPIRNQRGEIIAFGGRVLGEGMPKYLNSPETPLYDKSKNLYALHLARESIRKEKQAIIFEGYMDVIAAHQFGIRNTVASLGTSLTQAQARLLRNQTEEVVIIYDADAAGQAASWRGIQILRQAGCLVKVGRLPDGKDPDDYLRRFGAEAFRQNVADKALLLVDYQLKNLAGRYNLEKDEERIRFHDKVCEVLLAVENAMDREDYLQKAAQMLRISPDSIREELKKKKQTESRRRQATPVNLQAAWQPENAAAKAPWQIVALWARFPSLIAETADVLTEEEFPEQLQPVYREVKNNLHKLSPSRLLEIIYEEKYRQFLSRLLIDEECEEKIAKKAIDDCIRLLQCIRLARHRRQIEAEMAKLDPVVSKGEINELSREWLELRKQEEAMNYPKEGGKGVG